MVILPEHLRDTANGLHPDGAILGHGACPASETAGWTLRRSAGKECCSDYSSNTVSPQEASIIYSFPFVRDIVASLIISVYQPASGAPKSGYKLFDNLEIAKYHSGS